ncbi:hypothetical protein K469DRAFT_720500 [Zopfia rhizophila CBS 207.26]|uniref:Life-span regulatory factor-domain-containing protein n=1 Tax=Zopfia rhizophila CBS 207.26 TaxID=1314779 RepID=A0A6A6EK10_9PEZI|nr:hypothetical protein K469DRAFT_720500 [Zopfia rhizophila CBS 207.26]
MATHYTCRPSNHSKRPLPAHARPSKPAPLSKRTNSHGASKGGQKPAYPKEDFEEEEVMATSFLQYCSTCEKQIIVPNNLVLYCSESCRKKDNEKALSYPIDHFPPATPFANFSFEDFQFRDIVPLRSPTAPCSQRSSCAFSELSSDDNAVSGDEKSKEDSEASRYLRQFQSATATAESAVRPTRPRYNRASTSQATFSAAPSLSHTPASSVSFSLPYTPSTRPLPPRTNPHSSSYGSRSIDLVTPFTYTATTPSSPPQYSLKSMPVSQTSTGVVEGEILYEKKSPIPSVSPANGSLKRLFASSPRWA